MVTDRTALLIIRAWLEDGSPRPLRAQIRFTTDVSLGIEGALTLTDITEIGEAVQAWLKDVSSNGRSPEAPGRSGGDLMT